MDVSKIIEFIVYSLDKVGCLAEIGTDIMDMFPF